LIRLYREKANAPIRKQPNIFCFRTIKACTTINKITELRLASEASLSDKFPVFKVDKIKIIIVIRARKLVAIVNLFFNFDFVDLCTHII
jgi:hypothetical protein